MTEEPLHLWKSYSAKKDPQIKEQLLLHYLPLVQRTANKIAGYLPGHVSKEDLYSYGVLGLLDALDRYNYQLGISFPAFSAKRIKGAMIDGIRKEDWVPVSVRRKAKLIEDAYCILEAKLGRFARDEEIAAQLGLTIGELNEWMKSIQYILVLSLDEPLADQGDVSEGGVLRDGIPDWSSPNPAGQLEEREIKRLLALAVQELPEKERQVISLYYYHELSNKEIAQVMELSESRISQLHAKAVFRLRGKMSRVKKIM